MTSLAVVLPIDVVHQLTLFLGASMIVICHRVCKTFYTHMVITKLDEEIMTRIIINGGIGRCPPQIVPIDLTGLLKKMPRFGAVTEVIFPGAIRVNFRPSGSCRFYSSWKVSRNLYCEVVSRRTKIVYGIKKGQCSIFITCYGELNESNRRCRCQVPRAFVNTPKIRDQHVLVEFIFKSNILHINEVDMCLSECTESPHSFGMSSNITLFLRKCDNKSSEQRTTINK